MLGRVLLYNQALALSDLKRHTAGELFYAASQIVQLHWLSDNAYFISCDELMLLTGRQITHTLLVVMNVGGEMCSVSRCLRNSGLIKIC